MAVEIASIERPRKLPWHLPRTSADFRGDCRVAVAMAADGRGNCHGSFRGFPCVAMVGTTEFATGRTAATCRGCNRGIRRGSVMTRGTCSTVVNTHGSPRKFCGQCRGPPPKSQIMCILDFMLDTFFFFFFFSHVYFPASGQRAVVTGVVPSSPRSLPLFFFIAHRVQQSHCSSIFHRVLLTHALALSAGQFVHKKTSQRIYTSMHSAGLELTH